MSASGDHLMLDGKTYRFVGLNAYEVATAWGTNSGCGPNSPTVSSTHCSRHSHPTPWCASGPFKGRWRPTYRRDRSIGPPSTGCLPRRPAYHQRLIPVLAGQSGSCDNGHWADPSWYYGGFMDVFNGNPATTDGRGLTPLSYWTYLQSIVNRYRNSPALGMWEPMSEAEASTCPAQIRTVALQRSSDVSQRADRAHALRHFYDVVGGEIHALDPDHLVEAGLIGSGQCGTAGQDYAYVGSSPGIDVLSYHDYSAATTAVPGDRWNGLAVRFSQAAAIGKPMVRGEEGIDAGRRCRSDRRRAADACCSYQGPDCGGQQWGPRLGLGAGTRRRVHL